MIMKVILHKNWTAFPLGTALALAASGDVFSGGDNGADVPPPAAENAGFADLLQRSSENGQCIPRVVAAPIAPSPCNRIRVSQSRSRPPLPPNIEVMSLDRKCGQN